LRPPQSPRLPLRRLMDKLHHLKLNHNLNQEEKTRMMKTKKMRANLDSMSTTNNRKPKGRRVTSSKPEKLRLTTQSGRKPNQ